MVEPSTDPIHIGNVCARGRSGG